MLFVCRQVDEYSDGKRGVLGEAGRQVLLRTGLRASRSGSRLLVA